MALVDQWLAAFGWEQREMVLRLLAALLVGALIGFERSFHGRPAGFRTHTLVCLASTLLMLLTVFQTDWMTVVPLEAIRTDPTRTAQGIMTGIGFLGAGVIFREGLTIRGLTTAASIWITSALGILVGVGFYFAAAAGTFLVLCVLAGFRLIELRLPSEFYAHHTLRFAREAVITEQEMVRVIAQHGFTIANLSYRLTEGGRIFEYRMVIRSRNRQNAGELAKSLCSRPDVVEFRISPMGD